MLAVYEARDLLTMMYSVVTFFLVRGKFCGVNVVFCGYTSFFFFVTRNCFVTKGTLFFTILLKSAAKSANSYLRRKRFHLLCQTSSNLVSCKVN